MCTPLLLLGYGSVKNVTAATNKHETIEELLDTSFSMWSMSYQRKVGDQFFQELLVKCDLDGFHVSKA
jgi:hypothetical protein